MIKYIQKLQAKKGFTLVELIVVIAIIGVLAAILIPTMLNYVTNSRVTSADTTASEIQKTIDNFLTECDTLGYGMLLSKSATAALDIIGDTDGKWTVTFDGGTFTWDPTAVTNADAFKKKDKIGDWTKDGSGIEADQDRTDAKDVALDQLAWKLKDAFPAVKGVCAIAWLQGGKTMYVAYTADSFAIGDKATELSTKIFDDFKSGSSAWNKQTAGVNEGGLIVGTAPKLPISTS